MSDELTVTNGATLERVGERPTTPLTVGMLAQRLGVLFPEADGEAWDVHGLTIGNPDQPVEKVAVALDATASNVVKAAGCGAQVLLTHHPAYLEAPTRVVPLQADPLAGGVAWEAVTRGVAVMSFHTACDASVRGGAVLADMLQLLQVRVFKPLENDSRKGYGRYCLVPAEAHLTLGELASRCTAVFGIQPRVWGPLSADVRRVVTWGGSLGNAVEPADISDLDCVICGEVKYHVALALAEAGVAVIELGHDVSEQPLTIVLAQAAQECGVDLGNITLIDAGPHWALPESIRI